MSRCSQGTGRVTRATAAPDPVFWHLKNRFRIKKILRFLCRFPPQPEGLAARTRLGKSCDSCRAGGKSPGTAMRGLCLRFPWAGAAPANRRLSQRAEGGRDAAPACRAARLLPGALEELCSPGEPQSSPSPKMLPGPNHAVLSPGASAAPEAGANPKQGLMLRDPVTRAGQLFTGRLTLPHFFTRQNRRESGGNRLEPLRDRPAAPHRPPHRHCPVQPPPTSRDPSGYRCS